MQHITRRDLLAVHGGVMAAFLILSDGRLSTTEQALLLLWPGLALFIFCMDELRRSWKDWKKRRQGR